MTREQFWCLLEQTRLDAKGDQDRQYNELSQKLLDFTSEEVLSFHKHFWQLMDQAETNNLWGAAYLINGGCSDDGFDHFRYWLISMGKGTYEHGVANPDSLTDVVSSVKGFYEFSWLGTLAAQIYRKQTAKDIPIDSPDDWQPNMGDDWDFGDDQEMKRRLPRLSNLYLSE